MPDKFLFICNRIPTNDNAGGILYRDILDCIGFEHFDIISISNTVEYNSYNLPFYDNIIKQFELRLSDSNYFFKILKKIPGIEDIYMLLRVRAVKNFIKSHIIEKGIKQVFVALRSDVLLVIDDLLNELDQDIRLYGMIEDTVEREIDSHFFLYNKKKKNYYKAIKHATKVGVASENMQSLVKHNFQKSATIIRPSYSVNSNTKKCIEKDLNIFFAGNIYARKEFDSFLEALDSFSSTTNYSINFFVASHRSIKYEPRNYKLIRLGWKSEEELRQIMTKCHIAYLPYKMEKRFKHAMTYAFPGKAGFYTSCSMPILFHGKSYSSFSTFNDKYSVGVICEGKDHESLVNSITELVSNADTYFQYQVNSYRAFKKEFSRIIFEERIRAFFYE